MSLDLDQFAVSLLDGAPLFPPLTLRVPDGTTATLMGPSGIGKSTLLDAIGGHLAHEFRVSGQVRLLGKDILSLPAERRRVGILFQDPLLFPHLSVGDNLAFGLARARLGRAARREAVLLALEQAGLAGFADRDPSTLSGGQRARAALMRTLLSEPAALLLDEPFSKLDTTLRVETRQFTFRHIAERKIPALLVTHDRGDADAAGGAVIELREPSPAQPNRG